MLSKINLYILTALALIHDAFNHVTINHHCTAKAIVLYFKIYPWEGVIEVVLYLFETDKAQQIWPVCSLNWAISNDDSSMILQGKADVIQHDADH